MSSWSGRILLLALAGVVAYQVWIRQAAGKRPAPAGPATSAYWGCETRANQANGSLHDAGLLLLRPPVDADAWRAAEARASSAISAAESLCSGGATDAERPAIDEVRNALGSMRALLGDLSEAARGAGGGINPAQRQEQIEAALDRARALMGGRPRS
jgi:hypothetical protein